MCFLLASSSQVEEKKKNTKKKKTIEEKKIKEGKELTFKLPFYLLMFGSCFCLPASAFLLLPFCFKCFFLASFFSQIEEKKKTQRKKNYREEKNYKEGREFTFKLLFRLLIFGSCFYPFAFAL